MWDTISTLYILIKFLLMTFNDDICIIDKFFGFATESTPNILLIAFKLYSLYLIYVYFNKKKIHINFTLVLIVFMLIYLLYLYFKFIPGHLVQYFKNIFKLILMYSIYISLPF